MIDRTKELEIVKKNTELKKRSLNILKEELSKITEEFSSISGINQAKITSMREEVFKLKTED